MKIVNVHQAKTNLSQLLADVEHGEDIVIARNGTPIALLSHIKPIRREPGILRKHADWADFVYDASVFAPLSSNDELAAEGCNRSHPPSGGSDGFCRHEVAVGVG